MDPTCVVRVCNLRCPSCPVGNLPEAKNATSGYMEPELLDAILRKATSECRVGFVCLYNWTEPLLHPKLPEMIRTVRSHGVSCALSTNLNLMRNINAVLREEPSELKISVSGFTQETYGITHRRGDIERVKKNMAELSRACERTGSKTRVYVNFHRYLGNHEDESRMRDYAKSLGFDFTPAWAYLMPLEKMLALTEPASTDVKLNEDDRELISRLALPLDEAIRVTSKRSAKPCKLRDEQMAITWQGDVMLCCTAYDQSRYTLAGFLDTPLAQLQALKYRDPACTSCMKHGIHQLFTYESDELDGVALANVARHHPDAHLEGVKDLERRRWLRRRVRRAWKRARRAGHTLLGGNP
jgi:MoaA/NifB/PqqE/SkfB family radical SAM enzyme